MIARGKGIREQQQQLACIVALCRVSSFSLWYSPSAVCKTSHLYTVTSRGGFIYQVATMQITCRRFGWSNYQTILWEVWFSSFGKSLGKGLFFVTDILANSHSVVLKYGACWKASILVDIVVFEVSIFISHVNRNQKSK